MRSETRSRLLILFAICCGSLAVGLFYRFRVLPRASGTDAQARSLGYSSAADQKSTTADFASYWPDIVGSGRLTDAEYALAADTLDHGSQAARLRIIIVMGYLRNDKDRKRALGLLPTNELDPSTYALWRQCFRRWMSRPHSGQSVPAMLADSGNPNAVRLASELKAAGDA